MTRKPAVHVRHSSFASPLGWLLVAASPGGIGLLHFCGDQRPTADTIRGLSTATFRRASLEQAPRDPFLLRAQDAILAYLERGEPLSGLPVDVSTGTPFQQSVWQALCRIAHGTTQSYSEIATVVGRPRAARAVGRACGSNPVAILIPCHRVIARDGSLGGYSGGLRIKQALLDLEAAWVLQRSS